MTRIIDLSKTVLYLQPRSTEAFQSLDIPQNQPFITAESITGERTEAPERNDRDGTPHLISPEIMITIETDKIPRNPTRGWIFGSDSNQCDYLLDTEKDRGVSGTHFEIYHNWESMVPIIVNLSSDRLRIKSDHRLDSIQQGAQLALSKAEYSFKLGPLTFSLETPDRGQQQSLYKDNLKIHHRTLKDADPNIASLPVMQGDKITSAVNRHPIISNTTSIDKYHRREILGRGGTGTVYSGIDKFSGCEVALKEFHDRRLPSRISSEVEILRRISHVHIIRYIEVIENPNILLVMEFVSGGSLADYQNDVSRYETVLMARQVSQALSYLHDQEITHRDIKPANILLAARGHSFHCKLADFGEASKESILTTFCGTSFYQAPEITKPPYSNSVDIWSFGIILVEFWFIWYSRCLGELSDIPRTSWLPDTQRANVPGADTFQKDKFRELSWTPSRKTNWHGFARRRLKEEQVERHCSMAQLLLQMLEVDPLKRCSASHCRYHLDSFSLPEESGIHQGSQNAQTHKRNADLAGLGIPDGPHGIRRKSEGSTVGSTLDAREYHHAAALGTISEDPTEQLCKNPSEEAADFSTNGSPHANNQLDINPSDDTSSREEVSSSHESSSRDPSLEAPPSHDDAI